MFGKDANLSLLRVIVRTAYVYVGGRKDKTSERVWRGILVVYDE